MNADDFGLVSIALKYEGVEITFSDKLAFLKLLPGTIDFLVRPLFNIGWPP